MPKQKRDYDKLKKEFMASKFTEVKQFIEDKWTRYNATRSKNTKWWAKEKRELKARAADKAIKKVEPYHGYGIYYTNEHVRRKEIKKTSSKK